MASSARDGPGDALAQPTRGPGAAGALLGAPTWLVDFSPFVHLGLPPPGRFALGLRW